MKASLAPKEREISTVPSLHANVAQILFPFVFTIIFSNLVISILVDTYLRQRGILNARTPGRGSSGHLSPLQVGFSHARPSRNPAVCCRSIVRP